MSCSERPLTDRQENFCRFYVETGNKTEAYRRAYPKSLKWKPHVVHEQASRVAASPKLSKRINELKEMAAAEHLITIESVSKEYADLVSLAKENKQLSAAVSALTKKAELYGLFKLHQEQGKASTAVNVYQGLPDHVVEMIKQSE